MRASPTVLRHATELRRVLLLVAASVCTVPAADAQTNLLPNDALNAFSFVGAAYGSATVVTVDGMPFSSAIRVSVDTLPPESKNVRLSARTIAAVAARDAIVAAVWVRRIDSSDDRGLMDLVFEGGSPIVPSLVSPVTCDERWRRIAIPLVSVTDAPAGQAWYEFRLGHQLQTLELGGFELFDHADLSAIPGDALDAFDFYGAPWADAQIVPVAGQSFDRAWRITVTSQPPNPWDVALTTSLGAPIEVGDTMALVFSYRNVGASVAWVRPLLEVEGPPWSKSLVAGVTAEDSEWRRVLLPFRVADDSPSGQWGLRFQAGVAIQTIEIGDVHLIDFDTALASDELTSGLPYDDRSPLAAWRGPARQRIETQRKSALQVVVRDVFGAPVPNAEVHAVLRKHSFGFGSSVVADILAGNSPDDRIYQGVVASSFNMAASENFLKWPPWEAFPKSHATDAIDWLEQNGLRIRGHNLVWPGWDFVPPDVPSLSGNALRQRVLDHVAEEAGYAGVVGRIEAWDVVNESYENRDIQDRLGDDTVLEDWMHAARSADPAARLFLNDYNLLSDNAMDQARLDHYENLILSYQASGVPIDGMGFQSHFQYDIAPMNRIEAILDRFAGLGLELHVTEYDHGVEDRSLQADYLEDFMTLAFSHPAVEAFVIWGFWDGDHWRDNAPLYLDDWTLKPSGEAWYELVHGTWTTDESGTTGAGGGYALTGFHGEYDVTVRVGECESTVRVTLPPGGTVARVIVHCEEEQR